MSLEAIGVGASALLFFSLLLFLPASHRGLARRPGLLLVAHLGVAAIAREIPARVPDSGPARRFAEVVALVLLLGSIGRSLVVLAMHVVLERRGGRPVPVIFHDLAQGISYVVVLLLALHGAGVDPGSLVTSGALLTAAVALSLQETLGNVVAGLAMQAQRPFDVGDWIQFDDDPKHVGRVVEINWRATKIVTHDDVAIVVPNATLAKAPIANFSKPDPISRRSIYVSVGASVAPHVVRDVILRAVDAVPGIVREPPPCVVTNDLSEGSVQYWVQVFTDRFERRSEVDGAVRDRIWYALNRAGIEISLPSREVRLEKARDAGPSIARHEEALAAVDFLRVIPDAARRALAERGRVCLFGAGETVVKQGESSSEMYVVESGEVRVAVERASGEEQELARLGPGAFFGEMALMTGEARNATVRAVTTCTLFAIDHDAFQSVLDATPDAAALIARIVAERQAAIDARPEGDRESIDDRSTALLGRLKRFFSLR